MSEYQPEAGQWRLISPSGAEYVGESPTRAVIAEVNARVPADVALKRIFAAYATTIEDKQELDAHLEAVDVYADALSDYRENWGAASGLMGEAELVALNDKRDAVRASALKLMGLSDD